MPAEGEGQAPQNSITANAAMNTTFLERAWAWLHETFPERQVYIRSDGRVQFFTFGPSLQATLAGLVLIFAGWVAFATVNVVFKDRIIAAKDHRYQQMQQAYEGRVADLQMSYDELNGALVSAEDRFKTTADALQAKQNAIAGFLNKAAHAERTAGFGPGQSSENQSAPSALPFGDTGAPGADSGIDAPAALLGGAGTTRLTMLPGLAAPQARTDARPADPGLLQRAWKAVTGMFRAAAADMPRITKSANARAASIDHPALKGLARQTARLAHIGQSETLLMARAETRLDQGVTNLRAVMTRAGLNPDKMTGKLDAQMDSQGVGGPEIALDQVRIDGIADPGFTRAYLSAAAVLDQLNSLSTVLAHVPLSLPVSAASFDRSSGFGVRPDPFTGRYAFHPGIDLAGPRGAMVRATAPGTVVFAGYRGGYGNMVEVDHGFGLHTRYGHLSKITVRPGAKIAKGTAIGRVGSTGRSTGPHVHYEVWYDNVVKNPNKFIEAGRHVL